MEWERFFPYDVPYSDQYNAIKRSREVMENRGYFAMEAACGTGKTIISLVATSDLVKNPRTDFCRTIVATPVKSQLLQFVNEAREMNSTINNRNDQLNSIVLIGKSDLHPYLREEVIDEEGTENLSDLRDRTAEIIKIDSEVPLSTSNNVDRLHRQADTWFDIDRAKRAVQRVRELTQYETEKGDIETMRRLTTDGVESPYPTTPPETREIIDGDPDDIPPEADGPFDPFLLGYYASGGQPPFGFSAGQDNVLTAQDIRKECIKRGICPYESMAFLAGIADLIIGNYYHVFDSQTQFLTDGKIGILDEETLLVVDEAHELEQKARDMFSDGIGKQTLRVACNDLKGALEYIKYGQLSQGNTELTERSVGPGDRYRRDLAKQHIEQAQLTENQLRLLKELLDWLEDEFLHDRVTTYLDEVNPEWQNSQSKSTTFHSNEQVSLQKEDSEQDDLSLAIKNQLSKKTSADGCCLEDVLDNLRKIGEVTANIWESMPGDREHQVRSVTNMLDRWLNADTIQYFRAIDLEYSPKDEEADSWEDIYNSSLELYNCIPADDIAIQLSELGGGILMSATLEPHDVYSDVSGLSIFTDQTGRQVESETYEIHFPEKNRASLIGDLPEFTYNNRGDPTIDYSDMKPVRKQYATLLTSITRTYGNILIGMPSYREAEWLFNLIDQNGISDKEILLDEPSTFEETKQLLRKFKQDDDTHRVLVTSIRGTITEGVDFAGEKLHTTVVVGVPITNTKDDHMEAIRDAYAERYGEEQAFTYTFAIPAVRKSRQAIGRVIRNETDVGARVLLDKRYTRRSYRSVNQYLSKKEKSEFKSVGNVADSLDLFWAQQGRREL